MSNKSAELPDDRTSCSSPTSKSRAKQLIESHDSTSSTSSSKSITEEQYAVLQAKLKERELNAVNHSGPPGSAAGQPVSPFMLWSDGQKSSIEILCDTMKRQLMSRAFYGWLAHTRHLRTVRTHLAILVNPVIVPDDTPCDARGGLQREQWAALHDANGAIKDPLELQRLIYYGGVEHSLRRLVWPYLLAHYDYEMTEAECRARDKDMQHHYEATMSEWLAVEAIVRQRDKEIMAANLAKLSSESTSGSTDAEGARQKSQNNTPTKKVSGKSPHQSVIRVVSGDQLSKNQSLEQALKDPENLNNMSNEVFEEEDLDDDHDEGLVADQVSDEESVYEEAIEASSGGDQNEIKKEILKKVNSTPPTQHKRKAKLIRQDSETHSIASGPGSVIVTNPSIDSTTATPTHQANPSGGHDPLTATLSGGSARGRLALERLSEESDGQHGRARSSNCPSPVSSNGGVYSVSLRLIRTDL